jgi:hypothetical protein
MENKAQILADYLKEDIDEFEQFDTNLYYFGDKDCYVFDENELKEYIQNFVIPYVTEEAQIEMDEKLDESIYSGLFKVKIKPKLVEDYCLTNIKDILNVETLKEYIFEDEKYVIMIGYDI